MTPITDREIKEGALAFLEVGLRRIKQGWTQFTYARNEYDLSCQPWDDQAIKWCLIGSFHTHKWNEPDSIDEVSLQIKEARRIVSEVLDIANVIPSYSLSEWNDEIFRRKEDVIRALTLAIAQCKRSSNDVSN